LESSTLDEIKALFRIFSAKTEVTLASKKDQRYLLMLATFAFIATLLMRGKREVFTGAIAGGNAK